MIDFWQIYFIIGAIWSAAVIVPIHYKQYGHTYHILLIAVIHLLAWVVSVFIVIQLFRKIRNGTYREIPRSGSSKDGERRL